MCTAARGLPGQAGLPQQYSRGSACPDYGPAPDGGRSVTLPDEALEAQKLRAPP